jgi:penicillin-insensitive murein DD-endopeptidase
MRARLTASVVFALTAWTPQGAAGDGAPGDPETPTGAPQSASLRVRADNWSRHRTPKAGPAHAIGSYTNGCLQGGVSLPPSGRGYEVLRPGRHRWFGHPDLVAYVRRLGAEVKRRRLGILLVGDLAQPRGGPTPFGHRSHQSGLDVDIGYTYPSWLVRRKITAAERESLPLPAVVDLRTKALNAAWKPGIAGLLALAASDPAVDRIFVHPAVKRELCARPPPEAQWLQKVRPWWGHHDHFHVRLRCPAESNDCQPQEPLPPGDGCAALDWWFTEDARRTQQQRRDLAAEEARQPPPLPSACGALLD